MNWFKEFPQQQFLELISSGRTETEALAIINEGRGKQAFSDVVLVQLQVKSSEFKESLEEAKRVRADYWFNGIASSVGKVIDKDQVGSEKLKFEQRKYLAAIDNPEKYSEKVRHEHNVELNIFAEMKALPANEIKKLINLSDPFTIDAEVIPPSDEEEEGDIFS